MLSSNTLFHFTKNTEILAKILINGFRPSYCAEDFSFLKNSSENSEFYIPMVCFCDIPLSQIHQHTQWYGKFGLGMDINWGMAKGISPLTYVFETSELYYSLQVLEKLFYLANSNNISGQKVDFGGHLEPASKLSNLLWNIIPMLCYLKPYKAVDSVSGLVRKYYDEKEWRFLPGFKTFPDRNPFLRIPTSKSLDNQLGDFFLKEQYASHLGMDIESAYELGKSLVQASYLKFEIKDLKYLIVQNENDIFELIDLIKENGSFSNEEIEKIICRTITYKQIKEDF